MNPNDEKNLERFIHQTLRSLPERQAPRTLEHRVFGAIAARRAVPWWHRSFSRWPAAARLAFVGTSTALVAALLALGTRGTSTATQLADEAAGNFAGLRTVARAFGGLGETLFHSIPSLYLYGALALIGVFYIALFGLGATAYRTFFANR